MAVSENLATKVPVVDDVLSPHEQKICPITSLDENYIVFEFQMDWNYYVDLRRAYLALKLKFVMGCGYETYNSKEVKIGAEGGSKSVRGRDGGGRRSSSSRYSCKKHFALNYFQC